MQVRAGLADQADHGGRAVRAQIPVVAAAFLAEQPMIVIGAADEAGHVWASLLTGPPGFVHAAGPATVRVAARPEPWDPLAGALGDAATVGTIAIDPARRRRMRVNGVSVPDADGLRITADQVYANCPKYIQRRHLLDARGEAARPTAVHGSELTPDQRRRISAADTFFVATADDQGHADASHRGGDPGFVQVLSPTRLRWPDYVGNAMFMTLGNLDVNPAAGLLFPDFTTGTLLYVSGTARTEWDPERVAATSGAQRLVDLAVTDVIEVAAAVPLRWGDPEFSRANPPVGTVSATLPRG
ncbi:pyridoxamine 5'-phosphate oxidase family protein [Actinoallomurus vinaceus]|uniref:Pyridoxamine 5'-phosphate oxidase family protein n=1 Tax=Actinoallomurus vinaceus TaxID=1080074 RepID=A0ABP8ULQ9_9ACTN